ncbi:serine/threonine-protein kinase pim-1-like [Leuresthes tenuis]|uniref:serine/threonine-protein kinase pim-1-like n=1 Tax=Leuresthes tenuis TaxID=355514 RepID=UPI003B51464B
MYLQLIWPLVLVNGLQVAQADIGGTPIHFDAYERAALGLGPAGSRGTNSNHAGVGESSSNNLDGCTSDGDIRRSNRKRKALPAEETSSRKRTKKTETIQDQIDAQRAEFEEKYEEKNQLGEGGCGSVFAGCRRADNLPVAIKHIPKDKVSCMEDKNGRQISVEVAVMLKLESSTASSVGHSAPVSLLDWYDLQQELILVLERPMPAEDLAHYIEEHGGSLQGDEAKIIIQQLVDAAVHLKQNNIFHRDIKVENILIETGSDVPRLRLIDFGLSCINKKTSKYRTFYSTSAHVPPEWLNSCTYSAGPTTVWQVGVVLFEMLHNKEFRSTNFIRKNLRISSTLSQGRGQDSEKKKEEGYRRWRVTLKKGKEKEGTPGCRVKSRVSLLLSGKW